MQPVRLCQALSIQLSKDLECCIEIFRRFNENEITDKPHFFQEAWKVGREADCLTHSDGWIGVDLDGTLARYDGWRGPGHIGHPIPEMMARVKKWLSEGRTVKIFTARCSVPEQLAPVKRWLADHGIGNLEVTNTKDHRMMELWDDRAVRVGINTGKPEMFKE